MFLCHNTNFYKRLKQLLCLCLLSAPCSLALASHRAPSPWDGSNANFGLNINTGDTDTKDLSTGAIIQYTHKKWSENLNVSYQMAYSNHKQNKSIFNGTDNISYYFSDDKKTFLAGNFNGITDITSEFRYTLIASIMYGRTLKHSKHWNWTAQLGPGYRYNAGYQGESSYQRPVGVFLTNLTWEINKWGTLEEQGRFEFGNPYNYYQSTTSLTNKLIGHLALQMSFQINHYSALPATKKRLVLTNTITMASLVYNF